MPWDPEFWTQTLRDVVSGVAAWTPVLLGALLLLVLGWVVGRLARFPAAC